MSIKHKGIKMIRKLPLVTLSLTLLILFCGCQKTETIILNPVLTESNSNDINFSFQNIRTDCYDDDTDIEYPIINVIQSLDELKLYYNKYKDSYDFSSRDNSYHDSSIGFANAMQKYPKDFFNENFLVIILQDEPSGSIRHEVDKINENGEIDIYRICPEIQQHDAAWWNIIIELNSDFSQRDFSVNYKDINSVMLGK